MKKSTVARFLKKIILMNLICIITISFMQKYSKAVNSANIEDLDRQDVIDYVSFEDLWGTQGANAIPDYPVYILEKLLNKGLKLIFQIPIKLADAVNGVVSYTLDAGKYSTKDSLVDDPFYNFPYQEVALSIRSTGDAEKKNDFLNYCAGKTITYKGNAYTIEDKYNCSKVADADMKEVYLEDLDGSVWKGEMEGPSAYISNSKRAVVYPGTFYCKNVSYVVPNIRVTPVTIFSNSVPLLNANYFSEATSKDESPVKDLKATVAAWYKTFRLIAIVALLTVLVYLGIRILISSIAEETAKYKKMLVDWLIAICLVFCLHYIMAFTMTVVDQICGAISNDIDTIYVHVTRRDTTNTEYDPETDIKYTTNLVGYTRTMCDYTKLNDTIVGAVLYCALTFYTVYFLFVYLKRLLMLTFFTFIAPLVAITYPIDKIRDGKAQAFNYWLKEYMVNATLPIVHLILYSVFVGSSIDLAIEHPIYAIAALAFIVPAEKIIKSMFGIQSDTAPKPGGIITGAAAGGAIGNLAGKAKGLLGGGNGSGGQKDKKPRTTDQPTTSSSDSSKDSKSGGSGKSGMSQKEIEETAAKKDNNEIKKPDQSKENNKESSNKNEEKDNNMPASGTSEQIKKPENDKNDKDEIQDKYSNDGFNKNADGEYFNPYTDEYDPDYDPHNDPNYNKNTSTNNPETISSNKGEENNNIDSDSKNRTTENPNDLGAYESSNQNQSMGNGNSEPYKKLSKPHNGKRKIIDSNAAKTIRGRYNIPRSGKPLAKWAAKKAGKGLWKAAKFTAKAGTIATAAIAAGTIGLAAGVVGGDMNDMYKGLAGGIAGGAALGKVATNVGSRIGNGAKEEKGKWSQAHQEAKYGQEKAVDKAKEKEFIHSDANRRYLEEQGYTGKEVENRLKAYSKMQTLGVSSMKDMDQRYDDMAGMMDEDRINDRLDYYKENYKDNLGFKDFDDINDNYNELDKNYSGDSSKIKDRIEGYKDYKNAGLTLGNCENASKLEDDKVSDGMDKNTAHDYTVAVSKNLTKSGLTKADYNSTKKRNDIDNSRKEQLKANHKDWNDKDISRATTTMGDDEAKILGSKLIRKEQSASSNDGKGHVSNSNGNSSMPTRKNANNSNGNSSMPTRKNANSNGNSSMPTRKNANNSNGNSSTSARRKNSFRRNNNNY